MAFLTDSDWQNYRDVVNEFHEDAFQEDITWMRFTHGLPRHGEDSEDDKNYDPITLKCLIDYNVNRTWPITDDTKTGKIDEQSMMVHFNKAYLNSLGYIGGEGNFLINPGKDYFIHQGLKLDISGETPSSQAKDDPLLISIILKRQPIETGDNRYK